jgi:hypothetical protein
VHGLSEDTQINTGTLNGLGSREYTLIDTEPQPMKRHVFALDQRPTGERFREKFLKFTPFPYERHDGQGFLREQEIDTEFVKSWHGNGSNGGVAGAPGAAEETKSGD